MEILKKSHVKKMLPVRHPDSHKGENGRIVIIGGSLEFFGAPILAGLGALYSGADLVTLVVPECNFEVSRTFYPDFIVRKYGGNHLNLRALDVIHPLLDIADSLIIGPGLTQNEEIFHALSKILDRAKQPVVLDADALPAILMTKPKEARPLVITPHVAEFNELIDENFSYDLPEDEKIGLLKKYAEKWNVTFLLKGPRDYIFPSPREKNSLASLGAVNQTGNAGMTVGGTGDVLAGMVGSEIAQGASPFEACCIAAYVNGAAGDVLEKNKGFAFSATDIALELPYIIKSL